jgi:hypothetical protein
MKRSLGKNLFLLFSGLLKGILQLSRVLLLKMKRIKKPTHPNVHFSGHNGIQYKISMSKAENEDP